MTAECHFHDASQRHSGIVHNYHTRPAERAHDRHRRRPYHALHQACRRLGRLETRGHQPAPGARRARESEGAAGAKPARRFRLPRLRLARPPPRVHVRLLRKRRQGRRRRSDQPPRRTGTVCQPHRHAAAGTVGLRARAARPPDRTDGLRRRQRPLRAHRLGRRLRPRGPPPARSARCQPGRVLYVGTRQQRSGLFVPADGAPVRHEQLPRLLQHVP